MPGVNDQVGVRMSTDGCRGTRSLSRLAVYLLMLATLLSGWALRLYGLNWDQGHGVHPDERYITWVAASIRLPDRLGDAFHPARTSLNPYMWPPDGRSPEERVRPFSYGHLPLYLLVLVAGGDGDEARLALVGRVLSALFDTATILLTFALGRLLYGVAVGALAAASVTLTVMHVQLAHFATFDPALACLVVATLLFATLFTRWGRRRDAIAMGLCLGLAVGVKFSAVLLLLPVTMAHALRGERLAPSSLAGHETWHRWRCPSFPHLPRAQGRGLGLFALSLLFALLAFGLTNPFALLQPGAFVDNLKVQAAMLRGDEAYPFTLQYHGTLPFLYPIEQQLRWGMGLPLGLVVFGGLAYALVQAWRRPPRAEEWVPLTWALIYFGFTGSLYVKFMRYMLPLSPLLMVYGAALLLNGISPRRVPLLKQGGVVVLVLLPTALYALGFLNVYRGDHPWVSLSRWIYDHVPPGATIAYEKWDHRLPLSLDQAGVLRSPDEFQGLSLDLYAPDTPEKLQALLEGLVSSDYLVIASNRLYGSTARWPERYPLTRRYYRCLFTGQLGYQLVTPAVVERQPRLGPVTLAADPFGAAGLPSPLPREGRLYLGRADESYTVYDHPRPLLFCNVARLSWTEMERLFTDLLTRDDC
jgi:4-amino-4-deoxy-L-arabinose transferase-like glycosyltransferase